MLMVTTTVGMVDGVHSHTGNLGESLSLSLEFMEENTSFHDGFLVSSSSSDDSDCGSAASGNGLSGT